MKKGHKLKTIKEYFEENKEVLRESGWATKNDDGSWNYSKFANKMKEIMFRQNKRTSGAWRVFKHGTDFTSKEVIAGENVIQGMKNLDKETYKKFRKEVIGWKNKANYEGFTYNKDTGTYKYTNKDGAVWNIILITSSYGSQYWDWEKA